MKYLLFIIMIVMSGCSLPQGESVDIIPAVYSPTPTPFQPVTLTPKPDMSIETPQPTPQILVTTTDEIIIGIGGAVPSKLRTELVFTQGITLVENDQNSQLLVDVVSNEDKLTTWVFVLVAPFPTLVDNVSIDEIRATWRGEGNTSFGNNPLLMSETTHEAFAALWGPSSENGILILGDDDLLQEAWNRGNVWAIVPFEALQPRWKVIQIDGVSPLQRNMNTATYPLAVYYGISGDESLRSVVIAKLQAGLVGFPPTNRDESKMTILLMTGVTAMVRATAHQMEVRGNTYPANDVLTWFQQADLIHISNEVSFKTDCPYPDPLDESLSFCSDPSYIELLDYIGADIIDLTGNHLNDKGINALFTSLDMYQSHNMRYFAGGKNYDEAMQPLRLEHNGNKIAFLGCNWWGPTNVWATSDRPGAAPCDYDVLDKNLRDLLAEGYLPIFTYQYLEIYSPEATSAQKADFRNRAEAGAVIVSGSQAHRPQGMEFYSGTFIHYGLGNLFFDQTEAITGPGTQDEFLDVHVFYDGKYISTQLLTAYLENYSKPRPMTNGERRYLLMEIFSASGW